MTTPRLRPSVLFTACVAAAALLPAQDKQPLATTLRRAAAADPGTTFEARWQWGVERGNQGDGVEVRPAVAARGFFGGDVLSVQFETPRLERVQAGRHCIERVGDEPWRLAAAGAHARHERVFVPDPALLLRAFASGNPEARDRSIGERDGRAVEFVAVTADATMLEALVTAGAIEHPDAQLTTLAARVKADPSDPRLAVQLDAAFVFDVESRELVGIDVRAMSPAVSLRDLMRLFGRRGEINQAPPADAAAERLATTFVDGLPTRPADGMLVHTYHLRLRRAESAPVLGEDQRLLLGR
jgi:hypothetical protein